MGAIHDTRHQEHWSMMGKIGQPYFGYRLPSIVSYGDSHPYMDPLFDLVNPNISPTISLSGKYQKTFIYRSNRTNSQ